MLQDLSDPIAEVKKQLEEHERLEQEFTQARASLTRAQQQTQAVELQLEQAALEIARLEGFNLDSLLFTVMGNKADKLETARRTFEELRTQSNTCGREPSKLERQVEKLERQLEPNRDLKETYQSLLARKREQLDGDDSQCGRLRELADELEAACTAAADIERAIDIGNEAFADLQSEVSVVGSLGRCQISEGCAGIELLLDTSRHKTANQSALRAAGSIMRFQQRIGEVLARHGADEDGHLVAFSDSLERIANELTGGSLVISGVGNGPVEHIVEQLGTATALLEKKLEAVRHHADLIEQQQREFIESA